jgi:hypothetical protein
MVTHEHGGALALTPPLPTYIDIQPRGYSDAFPKALQKIGVDMYMYMDFYGILHVRRQRRHVLFAQPSHSFSLRR